MSMMSVTQSSPVSLSDPRVFFDEHCSKGGMIFVDIFDNKKTHIASGLFSTYEKADKWSAEYTGDTEDLNRLFVPFFVDYPEYGERKTPPH